MLRCIVCLEEIFTDAVWKYKHAKDNKWNLRKTFEGNMNCLFYEWGGLYFAHDDERPLTIVYEDPEM